LFKYVKIGGLLAVAAIGLLFTGCSKKPGDVEGTVKYADGTDVPIAMIYFFDDKGNRKEGTVNDGKFSLKGVPVGDNVKVVVSKTAIEEQMAKQEKDFNPTAGRPDGQPGGQEPPKDLSKDAKDASRAYTNPKDLSPEVLEQMKQSREQAQKTKEKLKDAPPVPKKYEKEDTTPLTYKITSGPNSIEIKLDAK